MRILGLKKIPALFALGVLVISISVTPWAVAQTLAVDSEAVKTLKRMTDHLGSLKQFSVHTQVTLEDVLDSGHRIDLDVSAKVSIQRPNKLRAERQGDLLDQTFYYNGETLTLYNPDNKVYATEPAPKTIEAVLDYTRESLGLIVPVADLVYKNAFELLTKDVNFAKVLDKTVINGVSCTHLLFSRPGVDFQVWITDGSKALPCKYVVTDTENPGKVSITTIMSDWSYSVAEGDDVFTFSVPQDAKAISFMPLNTHSNSLK